MAIGSSLGLGDILALDESTHHIDQDSFGGGTSLSHQQGYRLQPQFQASVQNLVATQTLAVMVPYRDPDKVLSSIPGLDVTIAPMGGPQISKHLVAAWLSDTSMAPGICMVLMMKGATGISRDPGCCRATKPDMAPC